MPPVPEATSSRAVDAASTELSTPRSRLVTEHLAANSFTLLNIELRHTATVEKLPFHHRDPFDRLLIGQAMTEKMTLVTVDGAFADYGIKSLW